MAAVQKFSSVLDMIEVINKPIMGVRMLMCAHFNTVPTLCRQWIVPSAAEDKSLSIKMKIMCAANVQIMIIKDVRIKEHPFEPCQL